jgi:hypothetical protein
MVPRSLPWQPSNPKRSDIIAKYDHDDRPGSRLISGDLDGLSRTYPRPFSTVLWAKRAEWFLFEVCAQFSPTLFNDFAFPVFRSRHDAQRVTNNRSGRSQDMLEPVLPHRPQCSADDPFTFVRRWRYVASNSPAFCKPGQSSMMMAERLCVMSPSRRSDCSVRLT